MNTTIASLASFDLTPLRDAAVGAFKGAGQLFVGAAGKAVKIGEGVGRGAKNILGTAVGKTTDTIKEILPFDQNKQEERKSK